MAGRLIFLIGASGSGKSVIARRLAYPNGYLFHDTNTCVVDASNYSNIAGMWEAEGEQQFRDLERVCVDDLATRKHSGEQLIISTGAGLPEIPDMMDRLNKLGDTIYLKASADTLWKRLSTDPRQLHDRPLLMPKGKESLHELLARRASIYERSSFTVDTERHSVDEVCELLTERLIGPSATKAKVGS